jgi:APA family basic amino acid/polyamine antiporter
MPRERQESVTPRPASSERGRLLQVLGLAFGLAVIVGGTIGVGILRTPGEIAARLPSEGWIAAAWLAGGAYALLGAISLAELGAMIPRSGGQYVFVRRALGEYPAFFVGWSDWISTSASIAAVAIVIGEYSGILVPSLAPHALLIAAGAVMAFSVMQWRGIKIGDAAQQVTGLLKALIFVALIAACFLFEPTFTTPAPIAPSFPAGAAFATAIVVALQSVIGSYDGWTGVIYFGEEVKDPGRDIPRAMIGGVVLVIAIYLALNFAFLHLLGPARMAGDPSVPGSACSALFGTRGSQILHVVMILSLLSSVNALLLCASRVPVAMSRDRLAPEMFRSVNAGGTPAPALFGSAFVTLAFLFSGTFDDVLAVMAFFFVASYTLSFSSVFVLRRREPNTPRPFRAWGYPWTTGIALIGSIAFLVTSVISDWDNSWKSLVILVASYPVFRLMRRAGRAENTGR